jgi:hypothetical protein
VLELGKVVDLNRDLEDLAYMYSLCYNLVVVEEDNLVVEEDSLVVEEDSLVVVEDNLVVVEDNLKVKVEYMFENVDIFHHHQKNLIGNHHY